MIPLIYAISYETYDDFSIAMYGCLKTIGVTATVCEEAKGEEEEDPLGCYCITDAGFGTFTNCLVKGYNNNTERIDQFISKCKHHNVSMTREQFWDRYDITQLNLTNVSAIEGFNATLLFPYPVDIDFKQFELDKRYNYINLMNFNYSILFGYVLMVYWLAVLVIASVVNWTIYLFPNFTGKFTGPISNWWRKNVTLPAFYGKKKTNAAKYLMILPSRMETIILTVFTILMAAFCGIGIYPVYGNSMYPSITGSLARLVAIRTGVVVTFMIPLLVLFAGRNNFLQWLTRWNFATFITYHRFISRIVILVVFVHAITFTVTDFIKMSYFRHMSRPFVRWGVVAGAAGAIIIFQGMLYARRKSYELFLIIHILMALFFIVGGYYHVEEFGYAPFMWATVASWAFDRVIRISRLMSFGSPQATVTLLAEETLRVVIPKPSYWHAIPGGHAFIHFLRPSCFWQSHPFTFTDSSENDNYIVMYIKLKGGVTHGVYKYLNQFPGKSAKIRVLVEGPYGEATSAKKYKNAVFIAGGNGIPGIYSECIDLARKKPNAQLKLIWILREWKSLAWFYQELKTLNNTNINTTIYITKPDETSGFHHLKTLSDNESSSLNIEKEEVNINDNEDKEKKGSDSESVYSLVDSIKCELSHIDFREGRPKVEDLIKQEISNSDGSTAFITCGHPVMVDEVRYSVASNLHLSKHRVEYFEQLQVWA